MRSLFFLLFFATAAFGKPVWMGAYNDNSGTKLIWEADSSQFASTPDWNGSAPCPFDLDKLTKMALDYSRKRVQDPEALEVAAIYLLRADASFRDAFLKDKWFITITFHGSSPISEEAIPFQGSVRILTDGSVIEPKQKK